MVPKNIPAIGGGSSTCAKVRDWSVNQVAWRTASTHSSAWADKSVRQDKSEINLLDYKYINIDFLILKFTIGNGLK
jgi:hypothetical protein